MVGLRLVLVAALCVARTSGTDYGDLVHLHGNGWPLVDLWSRLLYARREFDHQTPAAHGQSNPQQTGKHSGDLPVRLELETDVDIHEPSHPDLGLGPDLQDQAIAEAVGPYITPIANPDASAACLEDSIAYLNHITKEQWAMRMFDSTGKMPDGILEGNVNPMGNWDECLNTTASFNDKSFIGKYCMASLFKSGESTSRSHLLRRTAPVANLDVAPILPALPDGTEATVGVCIPSTCTAEELTLGLDIALRRQKVSAYIPDYLCYTREDKTELTTAAIVMIVILSLTGLCMVIGTVVDLIAVQAEDGPDSAWSAIDAAARWILPPTIRRVFLAFSVYTNGRKLLDTSSTKDTINCLHGIRFLSNTWVILGHNYAFVTTFKSQNILKLYSYQNDLAFQVIANATVSVDSFFFLSGLLVAYIASRNIERARGRFNIIMFYVHRYIRLTPVMMMIIGFIATLYVYLGSGPMWGYAGLGTPKDCQDYWWWNLLYISNLKDMDVQCLGQTWYLANDMQMFIFSPLVLLPLYHWPVVGQLWLIFLVCFFTGINAMITAIHKLGPDGPVPGGDDFDLRYMKPWTRAGPYLVGLYMGWILHKIRGRKIRLPAPVVAIGWITASLTGCLIVYGMFDYDRVDAGHADPSKTTSIVYAMLNRTAWSVCLAWVVFACVTGYGGIVDTLLSWKAFIPLSRLTYTSYLVSIDVQLYYWFTNKSAMYLDQTLLVYVFLGSLPVIFTVAAIFSLAFESPMIALEKIIFPQPPRAASPAPPQHTGTEPGTEAAVPGQNGKINAGVEEDVGAPQTEHTQPYSLVNKESTGQVEAISKLTTLVATPDYPTV
ncbi:nose resistant to fluoxetine protein 6-like [Pollicipes pollicipes]|uniref:nose resistant to fluoxetine protein 6-like n=1 Tax=Pollicipes pollicipes TaxID=41117 RepID=UPI00188566F3|nr:nose resistant to fluoxetine protein 6-like [Pollicipes pollicipes]